MRVPRRPTGVRLLLVVGLGVALVIAAVLSFYASSQPDGLQKVATDTGIAQAGQRHPGAKSPLSGYQADGVRDRRTARGVAGAVGVVVTFTLGGLLFRTLARRRDQTAQPQDQPEPDPAPRP